jgi:hypothetical protein
LPKEQFFAFECYFCCELKTEDEVFLHHIMDWVVDKYHFGATGSAAQTNQCATGPCVLQCTGF